MSTEKILVIKLGALGDFVQALGPMAAIRRHHAKADITLLTTKSFKSFGEECGYFNHVWIDDKPKWYDFKGWRDLQKKMNRANFNRVYDLQNNDRTSFYFRLFKKRTCPEWNGIAKGASHRNVSQTRTDGLAFYGHVQTLALAGIHNIDIDDLNWIKGDTARFHLKRPYALLVPGSSPERLEKRWPAACYGDLAHELCKRGIHPVLIGDSTESDLCAFIEKKESGCINLSGQTSLSDIVILAQQADFAVGNDTGPMHLIAPTKCPCTVLFSQHSNPARHLPKGQNVSFLQRKELETLSVDEVVEGLDF